MSPPEGCNSKTNVLCVSCSPTARNATCNACKMLSTGWPVSVEPKIVPAIQLAASMKHQRNCPARKNDATGSVHRYQTPCKKTAIVISGVIHKTVHHFGGAEPWRCHTRRITTTAVIVSTNGRPSKRRGRRSDTSEIKTIAASHASGRFRQTIADQPTMMNSVTTEKITRYSAFQFVHR